MGKKPKQKHFVYFETTLTKEELRNYLCHLIYDTDIGDILLGGEDSVDDVQPVDLTVFDSFGKFSEYIAKETKA